MSSTLVNGEINCIMQLGVMSQLRGVDSTGLVVVGREGNTKKLRNNIELQVCKDTEPAGFYLYSKDVSETLKKVSIVSGVIGHCRAATVGNVTAENAHPFTCEHITGVHNGTLMGPLETEAKKLGITDSEVLYQTMAEYGLQYTLDKCGFNSAYALVWVDRQHNTINFLRNNKRSLYMMYNKGHTTLLWASEKGMLNLLREREPLYEFEDPFLLLEHTHTSIPIGEIGCTNIENVRPKVEFIPPSSRKYEAADQSWWETMWDGSKEEKKKEEKPKQLPPPTIKPVTTLAAHPKDHLYYKYFENIIVPVRKAREYLEVGCMNCMSKAGPEDKAYWVSRQAYICHECNSLPFVREYIYMNDENMVYEGGIYKIVTSTTATKDNATIKMHDRKPTCH